MIKGLAATRSNIKECSFRTRLLSYCRESFEALLNTPIRITKKDNETEEDRAEREFKNKHKLFGNIEFMGELYKESIITDSVM
jgi:hypothetical protein